MLLSQGVFMRGGSRYPTAEMVSLLFKIQQRRGRPYIEDYVYVWGYYDTPLLIGVCAAWLTTKAVRYVYKIYRLSAKVRHIWNAGSLMTGLVLVSVSWTIGYKVVQAASATPQYLNTRANFELALSTTRLVCCWCLSCWFLPRLLFWFPSANNYLRLFTTYISCLC